MNLPIWWQQMDREKQAWFDAIGIKRSPYPGPPPKPAKWTA